MFQAFGVEEEEGVSWGEVVYVSLVLVGAYILYIAELRI